MSEVDIPSYSIWSLEDQINPPARDSIDRLPGDVHLLETCGHLPHLEHSAAVNRLLRDFHHAVMTTD